MVFKKGQIAWNKDRRTFINCIVCNKQFSKSRNKTCSPECRKINWINSMQKVYNSEEVKEKLRQNILNQYQNGTRDKFKITQRANEVCRQKSIDKFKSNPTTKIGKRGYKLIYIPIKGWIYYHHYVWEKHYGEIQKGEIIHHIDKNPLNNKLTNLIKLINQSDHMKLHKFGIKKE